MDEVLDDDLSRDLSKISLSEENEINIAKADANSYLQDMRLGRYVLIFVLIITIIASIYFYSQAVSEVAANILLIEGTIGTIILGLCIFGLYHKPKLAFSVAFFTYLGYHILAAYLDPMAVLYGLILKLIIIYFLGKATLASFKLPASLERLRNYGVGEDELAVTKNLEEIKMVSYLRYPS